MRVLLTVDLALHSLIEPSDQLDRVLAEGEIGRLSVAAVAGLHELHDDGSCMSGDSHQLAQAIGGCELAVFDPQPPELHGAEELLDDPAPPVPSDDAPGVGDGLDVMGGEQNPVDRLRAFRRWEGGES